MTDTDKARAQRDALRNVGHRQTAGSTRAEQALQRYLGAGLYEARHKQDNHTAEEQDTEQSSDED